MHEMKSISTVHPVQVHQRIKCGRMPLFVVCMLSVAGTSTHVHDESLSVMQGVNGSFRDHASSDVGLVNGIHVVNTG